MGSTFDIAIFGLHHHLWQNGVKAESTLNSRSRRRFRRSRESNRPECPDPGSHPERSTSRFDAGASVSLELLVRQPTARRQGPTAAEPRRRTTTGRRRRLRTGRPCVPVETGYRPHHQSSRPSRRRSRRRPRRGDRTEREAVRADNDRDGLETARVHVPNFRSSDRRRPRARHLQSGGRFRGRRLACSDPSTWTTGPRDPNPGGDGPGQGHEVSAVSVSVQRSLRQRTPFTVPFVY